MKRLKTADQAAEKYGKQSLAIQADFTKEDDVKRMIENVCAQFGKIDVMVYSAGIAKSNKITDFQLEDWEKTIDVNLTGYFLCAKETAKVMIGQGKGSIIQINSKSGKVGGKHNTAYSASKFGGCRLNPKPCARSCRAQYTRE